MLGLPRRINGVWEELRGEAGRNAIIGTRFPSGREQGFSGQDQIARSFNGIKGLQRSILKFICANTGDIH